MIKRSRRSTSRDLVTGLAALPPSVQGRLVQVVAVISDVSREEKWVMRNALDFAAREPDTAQAVYLPQLLIAVSDLVASVDAEAQGRPVQDVKKERL